MSRFSSILETLTSDEEYMSHLLQNMIYRLEEVKAKLEKGITKDIDLDNDGEFTIPYNDYNKLAHKIQGD